MYKYYRKSEKEKIKKDVLNLNYAPAAVVCEDRQFHESSKAYRISSSHRWHAFLLTGCGHVTEEMKAGKENGIALMENGDYEGAVAELDSLIDQTKHVSSFEIDVLKYRGEAEFMLGDYGAAAYTYDTLVKVDKPRAEYYYLGAVISQIPAMRKALKTVWSPEQRRTKNIAAGYAEAMEALGAAYMTAGDETKADEIYQTLVEEGFSSTEVYNRWMMAAMKKGDYEEALQHGKRDLHSPMTGRRRRSPSTRRCVTSTWGSMRKRWSCSGAMRNSTDRMRKRIMRSRFL